MSATGIVLDASAVLAFVLDEDGGRRVQGNATGASISAVNWAEVVEKAIESGVDESSMRRIFEGMGTAVVPVDAEQAEFAAHLREPTRSLGLSLADRLCFALAASRGSAVVTADRAWASVDVGVEVRLIR